MPETNLTETREPENTDVSYSGNIKISVVSSIGLIPVEGATVTIAYTREPDVPLKVLTTDSSGQTPVTQLPAPPLALSLQPENEIQPYSEYNITVTAPDYEPVLVSGSEILADRLSLQPIQMNPCMGIFLPKYRRMRSNPWLKPGKSF